MSSFVVRQFETEMRNTACSVPRGGCHPRGAVAQQPSGHLTCYLVASERHTDLGEHHIVDDAYALHLAQTVGEPAGVRTEPLDHLGNPRDGPANEAPPRP
jgi:hypothetical protein